jgi:hypothetical protein
LEIVLRSTEISGMETMRDYQVVQLPFEKVKQLVHVDLESI